MVVIYIIEIFQLISIKQIFDINNSKWKYLIFYLFSYIMLVFVQTYEFDVRDKNYFYKNYFLNYSFECFERPGIF